MTYAQTLKDVYSWVELLAYIRSCGKFCTMVDGCNYIDVCDKAKFATGCLTLSLNKILRKHGRKFFKEVYRDSRLRNFRSKDLQFSSI